MKHADLRQEAYNSILMISRQYWSCCYLSQTREITRCDKTKIENWGDQSKNTFVSPYTNNLIKSNQSISVKTFYEIEFSPNVFITLIVKNKMMDIAFSFDIIFKLINTPP